MHPPKRHAACGARPGLAVALTEPVDFATPNQENTMNLSNFAAAVLFATTFTFAACGGPEGDAALETAEAAVVKGGDLPKETCARRESNGTLTVGACSVVCSGKTIYEPDTDAEVDAISSNGGVCNAAVRRAPGVVAPIGSGSVYAR
jgi:hypothetical protein